MSFEVRVEQTGGPDVLRWEEAAFGELAAQEVRLRHTAIGLNYIDIYFRSGAYKPPSIPFTPGMEAAGVVTAIGSGVDDFVIGDRVAYASPPLGAYSEERSMPADRLIRLPESIDDRVAAAAMLKGMTAQYLLRTTFPVGPSTTLLLHAAAGGVGAIACQWAKHLGATVIGTVGSESKAQTAMLHGCDYAIQYRNEDFVARVKQITDGRGVDVVYDSVGKHTFMKSLECLRPLGMMVLFGQSSGAVEPISPSLLQDKGSLFLTRTTLMTYTARRNDL